MLSLKIIQIWEGGLIGSQSRDKILERVYIESLRVLYRSSTSNKLKDRNWLRVYLYLGMSNLPIELA